MKKLSRVNILIVICLLICACGQASQVAPVSNATPLPANTLISTLTITPTTTPRPSPTAIAKTKITSQPTYIAPTLIPTIDPSQLPILLSSALSIETLDVSGYKARRITGWNYGFGGRYSFIGDCPGFYWLDLSHLILNPRAGQDIDGFSGMLETYNPTTYCYQFSNGEVLVPVS